MSDTQAQRHESGETEYCAIRVKGHIDARWSAWFDGMTLTSENNGMTVIHGPVADQAALFGLLQKLRDIGLPLVSVIPSDPPDSPGSTVNPRQAHPTPRKARP
jgi:hypothetical protein